MFQADCPECKAYGCRACGDRGYVLTYSDDDRDDRAERQDLEDHQTADTAESNP